ncbi:hypothetical protein GCM10020254_81770 [Streptomyces goshikiensis]
MAVLDLSTGARASAGTADADDHEFDTASIVKVAILAALLLQVADDGRALTAQERWQATVMIENSDNTAADALWNAIGGAKGLAKANTRLGLTETVPGDGPYWGLTQTTPDDQLRLLQAVFGEDSALPADARSYLQGLMGSIAADQDWGVSAAADDPESARLKNGWLARSGSGTVGYQQYRPGGGRRAHPPAGRIVRRPALARDRHGLGRGPGGGGNPSVRRRLRYRRVTRPGGQTPPLYGRNPGLWRPRSAGRRTGP